LAKYKKKLERFDKWIKMADFFNNSSSSFAKTHANYSQNLRSDIFLGRNDRRTHSIKTANIKIMDAEHFIRSNGMLEKEKNDSPKSLYNHTLNKKISKNNMITDKEKDISTKRFQGSIEKGENFTSVMEKIDKNKCQNTHPTHRTTPSILLNNHEANLDFLTHHQIPNQNLYILPETGLREYFKKKRTHFLERVFKGPPSSFRWVSWLIANNVPVDRSEDLFYNFYYKEIEDCTDSLIKRDLERTFPVEVLPESILNKKEIILTSKHKEDILYRVLKSFAATDKEVLYCQGMNLVVGFLLECSNFNEPETFYLLLSMFSETFSSDSISIRGFYTEEFPILRLYLFQFNHIFEIKLPMLKRHLDDLGLPDDVWLTSWFQTLFTIILPFEYCVRLWDCLFSKGLLFVFNFTIALLKEMESDLLKMEEAITVRNYFRTLPSLTKDTQKHPLAKFDIEQIINNAKKISISKTLLQSLQKQFSDENGIDFSCLKIRYEMNTLESMQSYHSMYSVSSLNRSNEIYECDNFITSSHKNLNLNFNPNSLFISRGISQHLNEEEEKKSTNTSNSHRSREGERKISAVSKIEHDEQIIIENNANDECDIDEDLYSEFLVTDNDQIENKLNNHVFNYNLIKSEINNEDETEEFVRFSTYVKKEVRESENKTSTNSLNPFNQNIFNHKRSNSFINK
jgi:hypothetical protein